MASGTQLLPIFLHHPLCVGHTFFPCTRKMAAQLWVSLSEGQRGHAPHRPLYAGDSPLQLAFTSHWPELGNRTTLRPLTGKGIRNCMHDCLNQSPFVPFCCWAQLVVLFARKERSMLLGDQLALPVPPDSLRFPHGSLLRFPPPPLLYSCSSFKVQPGATSSVKLSLVAHLLLCTFSLLSICSIISLGCVVQQFTLSLVVFSLLSASQGQGPWHGG